MLAWYRDLIRLRRSTPALADAQPGKTRVTLDKEARWLAVERGPVRVLCNLGAASHAFSCGAGHEIRMSSSQGVIVSRDAVTLPPDTVVVLEKR